MNDQFEETVGNVSEFVDHGGAGTSKYDRASPKGQPICKPQKPCNAILLRSGQSESTTSYVVDPFYPRHPSSRSCMAFGLRDSDAESKKYIIKDEDDGGYLIGQRGTRWDIKENRRIESTLHPKHQFERMLGPKSPPSHLPIGVILVDERQPAAKFLDYPFQRGDHYHSSSHKLSSDFLTRE